MIEGRTMFGVAVLGVSVAVGYGVYKYVRGKQEERKIRDAVNDMVRLQRCNHLPGHCL